MIKLVLTQVASNTSTFSMQATATGIGTACSRYNGPDALPLIDQHIDQNLKAEQKAGTFKADCFCIRKDILVLLGEKKCGEE